MESNRPASSYDDIKDEDNTLSMDMVSPKRYFYDPFIQTTHGLAISNKPPFWGSYTALITLVS